MGKIETEVAFMGRHSSGMYFLGTYWLIIIFDLKIYFFYISTFLEVPIRKKSKDKKQDYNIINIIDL